MSIHQINDELIAQIGQGSEPAFARLYKSYYAYLNSIAIYYLFDKNVSSEVVNDVFLNIWDKRQSLTYPIHSYLIRSVQNGCLNYIRMQGSRQAVLEKHREEIMEFHESNITANPLPIQMLELQEAEQEVRQAIQQLPPKCREIFEAHFYSGKTADEIAAQLSLSVSTVRVQIKNGMDRLKGALEHLLLIIPFI